MKTLLQHLLESSVILGILITFYRLVLHNQNAFKFNRLFILFSLLLSTIVPFIHLSTGVIGTADNQQEVFGRMLQGVNVYSNQLTDVVLPSVTSNGYITWIYNIGAILLFYRLIIGLLKLGGISRKAKLTKYKDFSLADMSGRFNPFSFFRIIFVNRSLYSDNDLKQIIVHEKAHIRFYHSFDIMLMEIFLILQWFNPFAWGARKLLKELHEFQADREVLNTGTSVSQYKMLLLFQASGARLLPVNNFNESITKKRFKMMNVKNINNRIKFRIMLSVVVITGVSFFFACDNEYDEDTSGSTLKSTTANTDSVSVYDMCATMPQYPGGDAALRKFISMTVKYPVRAQELGIQGRVYVKFVINTEGHVSDAKVVRSVHETVDNESLRVINLMGDWIPGRDEDGNPVNVSYTVPINFVLQGDNDSDSTSSTSTLSALSENVLYFIDGKEVSAAEIKKFDIDNIKSMKVVNDMDEVKKYTSKDVEDIVLIQTKLAQTSSVTNSITQEDVFVIGYGK